MRRGDLYRVRRPGPDPRRSRVFLVVSRQVLIDSNFSTVVCAPVYSRGDGLATQVPVGVAEGLKHESVVFCDDLTSITKNTLTDYVGSLSPVLVAELNRALAVALDIPL